MARWRITESEAPEELQHPEAWPDEVAWMNASLRWLGEAPERRLPGCGDGGPVDVIRRAGLLTIDRAHA